MKITRFVILGLLAIAFACGAQEPLSMIRQNVSLTQHAAANAEKQTQLAAQTRMQTLSPQTPQFNVPATPIAEAITADIQTLADGLQDDPVRIFNYVHDNIRHVLYFGSRKGAELTLLEKSGNDFDQCALLVALLRAAGYTNASYQFGWMELPYDATDGSHNDLRHWLQLNVVNTNWNNTLNYLHNLVVNARGYPIDAAGGDTNTYAFQRIWVTLTIGSTNYYLDPSFKVSEPVTNLFNLAAAMNFSSNALMSVAGGMDTGDYVTNLNEAALRGALTGYTTNLLNYIQSNCPNASVAQVLGGWRIVPSTDTTLPTSLSFTTTNLGGTMPVLDWTNEPTDLMSILSIRLTGYYSGAGFYTGVYIPQLQGQRLTLTFDGNNLAQLWQDDALLNQTQLYYWDQYAVGQWNVYHPVGYWDTTNNVFVDVGAFDQSYTQYYLDYASTYNIIYGFEPDWGWLQARQHKLDAYRQQGLPDDSPQVVSEAMNVMGLNYLLESWSAGQILAAQAGVLTHNHHFLGRLGQEAGNGYYFDIFGVFTGDMPATGLDAASFDGLDRCEDLANYFGSALEHGVIEQLQPGNLTAVSTMKILQIANTNGQAIFLATSNNWSIIQGQLSHYSSADLNYFSSLTSAGHTLLLPQNGNITLGSWSGYGYMDYLRPGSLGSIIQGTYYGGQVTDPNAIIDTSNIAKNAHDQQHKKGLLDGDPVDMLTGAFKVEHTDLSLGGAEPRGITLSRSYSSNGRAYSTGGMGPGWVHNYCVSAQAVAAPQACLGGTTPAQSAAMIAATCAALGTYSDANPDPKNWTVAALIAKWAIDQLYKTGISVKMGKATAQFVQQPDGSFSPPANTTMTLAQNGLDYSLQQRHGNTFNFDDLGRLSAIVDPYGQSLSVSYLNSTSSLPQTVTDWKNRSLTFNYTGTPLQLTSVSDSAGRSVSFGYNGAGDLTSVTDPENKTWTYGCDANHQITATFDADHQMIVSNIYDGYGRVSTQYTQGDTNKAWQILYSGWQTVLQDPAGGQKTYFYDDMQRQIGLQDALGNLSQTFFDGQDHVVITVSPLNETNRFEFDGRHNLLRAIDPLNFTNQFFYDGQDRLTSSVDPRGNTNRFGYNSQHSLTGSTNGAGDWLTFAYNADGTLDTRTDSAGTTTYGYDTTYRQLNSITYPGSLGGESFITSALGDTTSHTDGRGFTTSLQYNNRRELTNAVAPTNLTVRISYTPAGNVWTTTDARGFTSSNTWSATSKLLAMTLPDTPQGTPAITNFYDKRDWLAQTTDPLQHSTLYTNDAARQLISVTDPLLRTTRFGYDNDGRQAASTNAANEVTRREWSKRGELAKFTDAATHTVLRSFDSAGNQITLTNRNGKQWQFQFDAANRLTNTITPLNRQTKQVWNDRGWLQTLIEPSTDTASFYYDARGRLTNRVDSVAAKTFRYDANNNLTNIAELGLTNVWTFDAYNRVSSYRDADGNLIQYRYDANGNLTNLIYPGNRVVAYAYDSLNRLTNVTDWANRQTAIEYDLASRVKKLTRPNGTVREISYNAANEPTNIVERLANNAPIAFFKLHWDDATRVDWEFAAPLPHSNAPPTRVMTFDDDNRIATFNGNNVSHDDDGNLTYAPGTNNTFVSYGYDARNRLLNVGGVDYGYDPAGNRTSVSNAAGVASFVINPGPLSQVLMRVRSGVTNYYIYGVGLLYDITETATSTTTLTYHYDLRGSTVALTRDDGLPTDRIEYSAYGLMTYRSGTNDTPFLFNGLYGVQTDPDGLLYMRARYYNPYICRFVNADPIGFAGGLNFYSYADGNPVSLIDPFGLSGMDVADAASGIAYGILTGGAKAVSGFWHAVTHSDETVDSLFTAALHPLATAAAIGQGVENTFANVGSGLGSGNYEKAGEAIFGIVAAALPALKAAKLGALGEVASVVDAAEGQTVGSGLIGDIRPATFVRQLSSGEDSLGLVDELKQLTFQSRSAQSPYGLEHAVVTLNDGSTWVVSGGQEGINFANTDINQLIVHSHGITTGPSPADFNYLNANGQLFSHILELGNPNVIQFNWNSTYSLTPIK